MPKHTIQASLADDISKKQLILVRNINDTHIFAQQAIKHLLKAREQYNASPDSTDKPYAVPSHKKKGIAKRNDEELREIYDRYIETDLYNTLLVAIVSQCESFIFDVLRAVLRAYPKKIGCNVKGVEENRSVDLKLVLDANDIYQVHHALIEQRLHTISYAKPADYLTFLKNIAHVKTDQETFEKYLEVKATRDIIIHNRGIANTTYIEKAGNKARAVAGEQLPMSTAYFDEAIAVIKGITVIIRHDIKEKWGA